VAWSPIQFALAFSLGSSAVVVAVPAFLRDFHASRLAEPLEGLGAIAARASAIGAGLPVGRAFPAGAPLTPARVPGATPLLDPPGTWDHASWRLLDFRIDEAHLFSFQFDSQNGPERATFVASAYGDQDADGTLAEFSVTGEMRQGGDPLIYPVEIYREVE
jgi:hypothetical protein